MRDSHETQSVGQWMINLLITAIPIVNIIAILVWAFSDTTHPETSNWAKAMLIWFAIGFGLMILIALLGGGVGMMNASF